MRWIRVWLCTIGVFALVVCVGGCAGNGEGLDANGRPVAEGGGAVPLTPDFASIQANVFTPVCSPCHAGAGAPQGLRLDAASSYASLVGVPSSEVPGLLRVEPGDPANSYLVQKLAGNASVGDRMPSGQPALPEATIQAIRQWIVDGAMPSAASDDGRTMLAVQAVSPTRTQVAVGLSRPVDAALVNATTVELVPVGGEGISPLAPVVSVSAHNDALLLLTPRTPLPQGFYRLTLRGSGPAALADWDAIPLDGDADGRPGGDFVTTFEIGGAS